MSEAQWSVEDGLVSAPAAMSLPALIDEAAGLGHHLGTRVARHATVGDALRAADPIVVNRLIRARVHGPDGDILGPLAPRAAVGPEVTCFAIGTASPVASVTLRADAVVTWGTLPAASVAEGITLARRLAARGCTLVEVDARTDGNVAVNAAMPRRGLASLLPSSEPQPPVPGVTVLCVRLTWDEALPTWKQLAADPDARGTLQLCALGPEFVALQLVVTQAAPDVVAALAARHLPAPTRPHPDVVKALSLRSPPPRTARA